MLDESMRRLGGILASPSLVMSYQHTTPLLERVWLRRAGLSGEEAREFLALLCQHGLLDVGAKTVVYGLCRQRQIAPQAAVRLLLAGQGWPEEES
jgi:hypothetical protein